MDGFGEDFLACATFAGNKDGRLAFSRAINDPVNRLHGQGRPNKPEIFLAICILVGLDNVGQVPMFQGIVKGDLQAFRTERLDQEIKSPQPHGLVRDIDRTMGCHDDDLDRNLGIMDVF